MQPEAAVTPERRRRLIRAAEFFFAAAMRLVPRRYRFGVAVLVARAATPLLRLTDAYRKQELIGFDGPREIALHFVLNALTRNGTRFDPVVRVRGLAELERACAAGTGVLVLGPHAALTILMIRLFHDRGLDPVVITPDPEMRVAGTTLTVRTVQPSPTFLVKTRSRLRRGKLVCAMPDRAEHHGARTVEFVTVTGRVIVAPALMRVAARCGARVIFAEAHEDGGTVVGSIHSPVDASSGDAITEEFIAFVRERGGAEPLRRPRQAYGDGAELRRKEWETRPPAPSRVLRALSADACPRSRSAGGGC